MEVVEAYVHLFSVFNAKFFSRVFIVFFKFIKPPQEFSVLFSTQVPNSKVVCVRQAHGQTFRCRGSTSTHNRKVVFILVNLPLLF